MTDVEIINAFLARSDLSDTEKAIQLKCVEANQRFLVTNQDLQKMRTDFQNKETEFIENKAQLEAMLSLVLELERNRAIKSQ